MEIKQADNGFVAEWQEDYQDGEGSYTRRMAFECNPDEGEKGELECFGNLAFFVKEHFGLYTGKHSQYRIDFSVVANDCE